MDYRTATDHASQIRFYREHAAKQDARRFTATVESASGVLHTFEVLAVDLSGARVAVARKYPGTYLRGLRPVS